MAIAEGRLQSVRIGQRTNLIERAEIERYKREHLGKRGRPKRKPEQPAEEVP